MNGARLELLKNNSRLIASFFSNLLCRSLYSTGDSIRIQVVDHVPEPWQCDELALRQFPMQALQFNSEANRSRRAEVLALNCNQS